jgi:hypothetical protein
MGTSNPFNFGNWLHHDGNGGDDLDDGVGLGQFNFLTTGSASDNSNTTTIANIAEQNPAITGQNQSTGAGVIGIFGQSNGLGVGSVGVVGSAIGWGVGGVSTAAQIDVLANPYPGNLGVFGAGDNVGIYGQSRLAENQQPTGLEPPENTGVYGIGDVVGVEGDNDRTDPAGKAVGTGVLGLSLQGIGVLGQGAGVLGTVPPYVGVLGMSQANPAEVYPVNNTYLGTGVFGIGDIRGGVFQTTPQTGDSTFANIQLTPLPLEILKLPIEAFKADLVAPGLPADGEPGDILAVNIQGDPNDPRGVKGMALWVCIKRRVNARIGATWARVSFDVAVTTI